MDECVIVGGDWDPCAGRTRNQKDPVSNVSLYLCKSFQTSNISLNGSINGHDFKRCFCKDAAVQCLCCWRGKRFSPSGSEEISELRMSFVCALLSLIRGKKQSKNSAEDCDASAVLTLPGSSLTVSHRGFQMVWQGCEWLHTPLNALKPCDRVKNMNAVSWEMKDREASFEMPTLRQVWRPTGSWQWGRWMFQDI